MCLSLVVKRVTLHTAQDRMFDYRWDAEESHFLPELIGNEECMFRLVWTERYCCCRFMFVSSTFNWCKPPNTIICSQLNVYHFLHEPLTGEFFHLYFHFQCSSFSSSYALDFLCPSFVFDGRKYIGHESIWRLSKSRTSSQCSKSKALIFECKPKTIQTKCVCTYFLFFFCWLVGNVEFSFVAFWNIRKQKWDLHVFCSRCLFLSLSLIHLYFANVAILLSAYDLILSFVSILLLYFKYGKIQFQEFTIPIPFSIPIYNFV